MAQEQTAPVDKQRKPTAAPHIQPVIEIRESGGFGRALIFGIGGLVALTAALVWLASNGSTGDIGDTLQGVATVFLGIFIEALPFLLAGVAVSALIQSFVSPAFLQRRLPRNPLSAALTGALLGLVFPVCECGAVPTGRQLMRKGATVPLGVSFLIAAPAVNPIVIASTWIAFNGDLRLVVGRSVITIVVATLVGLLVGLHPQPADLLHPDSRSTTDDEDHAHGGKGRQVLDHALVEFFEMGRYMVVGALLAAMLQILIPQSWLLGFGTNPVASVLVLMALAVLLSICSTVDAFVALSFSGTFSTGALLGFLAFGPIVDLKSLLMFSTTLSKRLIVAIVLIAFQVVFLAALFVNLNVN